MNFHTARSRSSTRLKNEAENIRWVLFFIAVCGFLTINPVLAQEENAGQQPLNMPTISEKLDHIEWTRNNFSIKIGGRLDAESGHLTFNDELMRAFPDADNHPADLRRLDIQVYGFLFSRIEYYLQVDFANIAEIGENWLRWKGASFLSRFRIGHLDEPFSLEQLTSSAHLPFLEQSTATNGLVPGKNIGVLYADQFLDDRVSWSAGTFLNTDSVSSIGSYKEKISDANGWNIAARITGTPWVDREGRDLWHVGVSFIHGSFWENIRISAFPETRLGDLKLIDTGLFPANQANLLGLETAAAIGPLILSSESYVAMIDAPENLTFWGGYLSASGFLTGERRKYDKAKGVFNGNTPNELFRPLKETWGAWELAARVSFTDLNDGEINGGKELNWCVALNGYLGPNARLMLDYIHARVEDKVSDPQVNTGKADIVQARFQFRF